MTVLSREAARDELVEGLTVALDGLTASVYGYQAPVEAGLTPCVRVFGAGTLRPIVPETGRRSHFRLVVQVWVLAYDREGGWTEADAEDRLDAIEQAIAAWLGDNQFNEVWTAIEYAAMSTVTAAVTQAGETYLVEDIPIEVYVYG